MTAPSDQGESLLHQARGVPEVRCPRVGLRYYLDEAGEEAGWGASPIGQCGNPDRCGEKVIGLGDDDLALVDYRPVGAA